MCLIQIILMYKIMFYIGKHNFKVSVKFKVSVVQLRLN